MSFSQDKGEIGLIQMKKVTNKLNKSMTRDEIEKLIGKPTFETNLGPVYWFEGGERVILYYNLDKLIFVLNKGHIDLLATEFMARNDASSALTVFISGKELITSNPIVNINDNKYIPARDLEKALGIEVHSDAKEHQVRAIEKDKYGSYDAKIVSSPVFINGKELITSNPIVTIDNNLYLPLSLVEEQLGLKVSFNAEKKHIEIKTDALSNDVKNENLFDLFSTEYAAMVTNLSVSIDGNELSILNPILTINGNTYLPIKELEEELRLRIKTNSNELEQQGINTDIREFWYLSIKSVEIKTNVTEESTVSKNHTGIARFKEDIGKLNKGMTITEVRQILGAPQPDPNAALSSFAKSELYYIHKDGEALIASYDLDSKLSALFNKDGFDLFTTGYVSRAANFPVFVDDKELLISNPIVIICPTYNNKMIYAPIKDLAEQLGMKASFNEEKQQLEITTK